MVTKGYGFSVEDIDWSCPTDLDPYAKAYKSEKHMQDAEMWRMGLYIQSAVSVAVEHNLVGRKGTSKYIEKPILQDIEEKEYHSKNDRVEYKGMTDEQKQKAELNKAVDYFNSLMARF